MTERQLPLDLAVPPRLSRADFLPAPANTAALAAVDAWRDWPGGRLLLRGTPGSGRTHLAAIWAAETGAVWLSGATLALPPLRAGRPAPRAYAVDDADQVAGDRPREVALFHLISRAQSDGAALLLTGSGAPGAWGITLPDLESRLQATAVAQLDRPDDDLIRMVLVKLFDERQVPVSVETVDYLVRRIDRSLAAAGAVVEALDRAALSRQKRISRTLAAEILAAPDG
ncbi:MAG: chromosomal replication initiator DnaA [Rhodobacteraceae bacterium]|nr:chromosomal replication initiator DnaA [Paracoccaceae bacterium]